MNHHLKEGSAPKPMKACAEKEENKERPEPEEPQDEMDDEDDYPDDDGRFDAWA